MVIVLAVITLGVVGALVWGAWSSDDGTAVDDLPTVSEVVAAQAHRHGVELPELTDADRARLSAPPTAGSSLSPYDQVLGQLLAIEVKLPGMQVVDDQHVAAFQHAAQGGRGLAHD